MSTNPLKTFVLYKFKNYPFIVILTLSLVFADFDLSLSFSLPLSLSLCFSLSLSLILCPCHIINRYSHSHAQFSALKWTIFRKCPGCLKKKGFTKCNGEPDLVFSIMHSLTWTALALHSQRSPKLPLLLHWK